MLDTTVRPYLLRTVCEKLFSGNESVCSTLRNNSDQVNVVQREAATYFSIYRLSANIPAILTGLCFGAWSDKHGWRLPMLCTCCGTIVSVSVYLTSVFLNSRAFAVWVILSGTFIQGISGKGAVLCIAANCIISETSDECVSTRNTGLLFSMIFFGQCLGAVLAGMLEFYPMVSYSTVIGFNILSVVFITIFVKSKAHDKETGSCVNSEKEIQTFQSNNNNRTDTQKTVKPVSVQNADNGTEHSVKNSKKIYDSCNYRFTGNKSFLCNFILNKENRNAPFIIIVLFLSFVMSCDRAGVEDVMLLFVTRSPFYWTSAMYSYFVAFENIFNGFALLILLPLLLSFLKLSDFTVVIIALLCKIVRYSCTGFSNKSWMIYILTAVGSGSTFIVSIRSVLSKCVHDKDLGKLFSVYTVIEIIGKLVGSTLYVGLYGFTVSVTPNITFYIMGILNIIILIIFLILKTRFDKTDKFEVTQVITQDHPVIQRVSTTRMNKTN